MTINENDPYASPLVGKWIKSSYSEGNGPDCVEIMRIAGGFAVRDSKDPDGAVLRFTDQEMRHFGRSLIQTVAG